MISSCTHCHKPWPLRPSAEYVKGGVRTRIYAHKAPDGKTIHSVTESQHAPGEPDTPMPDTRAISLAPAVQRKPRGRKASR